MGIFFIAETCASTIKKLWRFCGDYSIEFRSIALWKRVVEHSGLEPLTSTLPVLRSTR